MSGLYPETVHEPQNVRCKSNSSWAQNNVYVENICSQRDDPNQRKYSGVALLAILPYLQPVFMPSFNLA